MKERTVLLLIFAVLAAGCSGNVRNDAVADALKKDPYEFLAKRLSEAHDRMMNRKVAVLPFSYTDKRPSDDGVVISERVLTRIIEANKLEVVERHLLEKVMGELKLQHSGIVDDSSIKQLGKVLGVEAVVTGTLTRHKDGRVEIHARLIRTESAAVLAAASGTVVPDWETRQVTQAPAPAQPVVYTPQRPGPAAAGGVKYQIAQPFPACATPPRGGLIGYWRFGEGSGTVTADSTGNGSGGRLNGPSWTADGKGDPALDFNGSGYVAIDVQPALKPANAVTLAAWVNFRTINYSESGSRLLVISSGYGLFIGGADNWDTNLAVHMGGVSSSGRLLGNSRLSPNTWYHAAATYDGSRVTVYLNGEPDGSFPAQGVLNYPEGNPHSFMGSDPTGAAGYHAPLDGLLNEVMVYDRALSPTEVRALYNSCRAKL